MKTFSFYEPRQWIWENDNDLQNAKELACLLEEAKAAFNPKDVPRIVGYNNNGQKNTRVIRIWKELNSINEQLVIATANGNAAGIASLNRKQQKLEAEERSIQQHYNYIVNLSTRLAANDYVKRFYPKRQTQSFRGPEKASDYISPESYRQGYQRPNEELTEKRLRSKFEYEQLGAFQDEFTSDRVKAIAMSGLE